MKNKFRILAPACLLLAAGCSQETPPVYDDLPGVYFYRGADYYSPGRFISQYDSVNHTFINVPDEQATYELPVWVKAIGKAMSAPRRVKLVQTNTGEEDAAVAGKHYVAFDSEEAAGKLLIPAGASQALLPIVLLRDVTLATNKYRLRFRIVTDDAFPLTLEEKREFLVTTTGQYEKPSRWDNFWTYAFGAWGPVKMWFIVQVVGFNGMDETSSPAFRNSMRARAVEKLNEYNAGKPESEHLHENDEARTKVVFL